LEEVASPQEVDAESFCLRRFCEMPLEVPAEFLAAAVLLNRPVMKPMIRAARAVIQVLTKVITEFTKPAPLNS
jgi:hypothetical protein